MQFLLKLFSVTMTFKHFETFSEMCLNALHINQWWKENSRQKCLKVKTF